ncbi:CsbD family protein [Streptomyces sp. NPDC049813]|uniref:CsbD family protein n=1 Tax=Streptomyces sp. NPDC049813 TaxID=3365597 RepID=UPI0037BE1531
MGESAMDKAKGKAKEMAGKATGNERMKSEGKVDQAKSKARDAVKNTRDKADGARDSLRDDDNR